MAKLVAQDVIEAVRSGTKINLSEFQRKRGYTETSVNAHKAIKTKTYKNAVRPVLERMAKLRDKVLAEMDTRDLTQEVLDDLRKTLDTLNRNVSILSGAGEGGDNTTYVFNADQIAVVANRVVKDGGGAQQE